MSTMVVIAFDSETGAERMPDELVQLQKEVGQEIQPGNSALFLLVREATVDRLVERLKPFQGRIIQTSLSREDEMKLREAFGAESAA